jgi:hypothetical protein
MNSEGLGEGYSTSNFYLLPLELKDLNVQAAKAYKLFITSVQASAWVAAHSLYLQGSGN